MWTAQMFLMFTLRRENVLPTGDFACAWRCTNTISTATRKGGEEFCGGKEKRKRKQAAQTERWRRSRGRWEPYRSVACWYMWRSLDIKNDLACMRKSGLPLCSSAPLWLNDGDG